MSSANYKPRTSPFGFTEQLLSRVKELEVDLARSRSEADDRLQVESARCGSFESSLLVSLQKIGIKLSNVPVAADIPHARRALIGES